MVATVGSIQVLFDAQYGPAVQSLRKFASETDKTGRQVGSAVQRIDRASQAANRSIGQLNGSQFRTLTLSALRASNSVERLRGILLSTSSLLGGFTAAFAIRGLQEYSDTYRSLTNQIKVSINEGENLAKTQEDIFQSAQRSRSEYEATAKLFSRINTSAKKLQILQKDSLRVTETIQKAFVLGGSTPTEAAQSSLQLSQGIASNRLGGDELRSVLENPALGQLLAKEISGGDLGKLRELSEQGKLTAGVVIRAFLAASKEIDALFKGTEQTVGQAFQRIDNALLKYVGTNENVQSGMSATIVLANSLADNIDTVAESIIYLGAAAAGVFGAKKLGELNNWVAGVRAARAEAVKTAEALRDSTALTASQASNRLRSAQLGISNAGNIADSKSMLAITQMKKAESDRIRDLKEEREAARSAAGAELQRTLAIKDATQAELIRAQQTAKNKGFIADSEANKVQIAELEQNLNRWVKLKQERDEVMRKATAGLEDATADRNMALARVQALSGDRAVEGIGNIPASASVMGQAQKELARTNATLAKAQEAYNEALRGTALTQSELNHINEESDLASRVRVLDNAAEAQKGLSSAYQAHAVAARNAAEAEAALTKATREASDISRVQKASDRRLGQEELFARNGIQAEARKELADALKQNAIATKAAEVASVRYTNVLHAQRAATTLATGALRGLAAVSDFLGGPLGVALVALSGYLAYNAYQAQKTQEAMDYYSKELDQTALAAAKTSTALNTLAASQERVRAARAGGSSEQLGAVEETKGRIATLLAEFNDLSGAQIRNAGTTRKAAIEVMNLRKAFSDGKLTIEGFQSGLDKISADNPGFADVAKAMIKVARAIALARGELTALLSGFDQVPGGQGAKTDRVGDRVIPTDIKNKLADDLRESSEKRLQDRFDNGKIDPLTGRLYGFDTSTFGTKGSKGDKSDPFGDAQKSTANETAELQAQAQILQQFNPLLKDYGKSLAVAKEAQDLLVAAQKGGQAVGKEVHDVQELLNGDLSKLSPAAREQAETIRSMANAYGEATAKVNQLTEANQKATEEIEWQKDVVKSSLSTFRESLVEGKSLWQALGDVALNVLGKIADKLETMFVDQLFNSSAGGGIGSFFSFLFGGGTAAASAFPAAPKVGLGSVIGTPGAKVSAGALDSLAAKSVGITDAVAQAAAAEGNANLGQAPIPIAVHTYFDENLNLKQKVTQISAGTAAPMIERGAKHFASSELPDSVDRHMSKPRRRRVAAL